MTDDKKREGPLNLDMGFDEALRRFANTDPKEITPKSSNIKSLAPVSGSKEITPQGELDLGIEIERDVGGVQNAHIGTISTQWTEQPPKPRCEEISPKNNFNLIRRWGLRIFRKRGK